MARIEGVKPKDAGPFVRLAYFLTKRRFGRVLKPITIHAHHPRLLRALAHMEMGHEAANTVDPRLKSLAEITAARQIGCPF